MIDTIFTLLRLDDFYNVSERVDIFKGKYEIPLTFKKGWKQRKRYKK